MIQTINISLIPSDNKPVINVSQYDNGLRVLRFNIFDDIEMEVPHEYEGETVTCNIRKNDNNIVVITGTIETETTEETETSYVQVVLTEQACACVGSNYGEISLSVDDDVIGTCNFKLIVERSPLAGGVDSQSEIDNLTTQIETIAEQVIGEDYYTKLEVDGLIDEVEAEIPTKTSQLTNDSGFITASDIPTIPTKTSQLQNDSGFITASDIPTIPTKTSQLTNDSGFITASDIPTIPTKTSQLTNDSGFTTIDDVAIVNDKTWSSEKIYDELNALLPVVSVSGLIASFSTDLQIPFIESKISIPVNNDGISALNIVNSKTAQYWNATSNTTTVNGVTMDYLGGGKYHIYGSMTNNQTTNLLLSCDLFTIYGGTDSYISFRNSYYAQGLQLIFYKDSTTVEVWTLNTVNRNSYFADMRNKQTNKINLQIGTSLFGVNFDFYIQPIIYSNDNKNTYSATFTNPITAGAEINLLTGEVKINTTPTTYDTITPINIIPFKGDNNIYSDVGETSITYKDTIQHYIDTRVNTLSTRSMSMMRTLETLERSTTLERGETDER